MSSMQFWRRYKSTNRTSENNTTIDPQRLEAGLAPRNLSDRTIPEESEDIEHNTGTCLSYEDKVKVSGDIADENIIFSTSTRPDQDHVEDLSTKDKGQEDVDSHPSGRRESLSRFLKWPHSTKSNDPNRQPNSVSADTNEQFEQEYQTGYGASDSTQPPPEYTEEARNLVRTFTVGNTHDSNYSETHQQRSGTETPALDKHVADLDYVPAPDTYKPSIFGAILTSRLNDLQSTYNQQRSSYAQPAEYLDLARRNAPPKHKRSSSQDPFVSSSGTSTPTTKPKWYEKPEHSGSMVNLLAQAGLSSTSLGLPMTSSALPSGRRNSPPIRPSGMIATAVDMIQNAGHQGRNKGNSKRDQRYDVVAEVADIIARRRYLIKLCGALMQYGAPTHRVEEYLAASARALRIDAQFMYIPGAMMCTFIDNTIQANSVELVRKPEGLDFGRLKDIFDVYKCVIHEKYTAEEGIAELEHIAKRPDPYGIWFRILTFGVASVFVGPFSFNSRPIDFGPTFILGCALGFLQLKVVPRSTHFSNVFEVFACVMAAFIARGLGSIKSSSGGNLFCFSGIAQSSIAMILPGFMVLNSALELQGRNIVAGSVRMVYSIIYVLFLGFGLLVGTTVFGLIKRDATDDVTCQVPNWFSPEDGHWKLIYTRFIWAPLFACCVALIYRAKWRQLPVMALIAACGHQANFWISTQLSSNLQVANAVGAFVIGCMANLYSRMFHGLAAAAMLPAIYCQVPGGLAASGSLVAGINSSNQIFGNSSSVSVINNGTQGFIAAQDNPSAVYGGTIFNVGYGMVQVAIGISVGLYLSALVVYPYGKRNSGLFSF